MKKDRSECFYLAIFAPDMKRLRYILAVLLSLTVVYAGAGVSIVHYCCARCEAVPNAKNLIKLLINRKNLAKTKAVRLLFIKWIW